MEDAGAHLASPTGGMKKVVTVVRFGLAKRESVVEDSHMLSPLDPAALPKNVTALRTLLLSREQEHMAELEAAREGLREQGTKEIIHSVAARGKEGAHVV